MPFSGPHRASIISLQAVDSNNPGPLFPPAKFSQGRPIDIYHFARHPTSNFHNESVLRLCMHGSFHVKFILSLYFSNITN